MSTLPEVGGGVDPEPTVMLSAAVWVRDPDVPVKTALELALGADAEAVRLTCCPSPGERVKVAGDAVTPCGKPAMVTWTEPVNPLAATAVRATACAVPPEVRVALDGLTCSEKSGLDGDDPPFTLSARAAVWLKAPDVPVKATIPFAVVADAAAAKLTVCGTPAERFSVVGVAVTPAGKPARDTWTVPAKPLAATAVAVTDCAAPPGVKLALAWLSLSEKSAEVLELLT